jgi:hypothetical protein
MWIVCRRLSTRALREVTGIESCQGWTVAKAAGNPYLMEDGEFAWDDDKAARNWRDHAVTFEMAREVFRDPFAIE